MERRTIVTLVIAAIVVVAVVAFWGNLTGQVTKDRNCVDNDDNVGGLEEQKFVASSVEYSFTEAGAEGERVHEDACYEEEYGSSDEVLEQTCEGGTPKQVRVFCENGCEDGACVA